MRVLVVLPTYNEAENVVPHLEAVLAAACAPDVLVVDDASPDGTAKLVERESTEYPGRVHLLERDADRGLGRAYVAGFTWALDASPGYDVVVQMDVDGSHDPQAIDALLEPLAAGRADLVLGSRYVHGGAVADWPLRRRLLSVGGNVYAALLLRLPLRDLTGGFKAWRADVLRRVELASVRSEGYAFQIEMTWRAVRVGARVVEVPIVFRDRVRGESKMNSGIAREAIREVWRMARRPQRSWSGG